MPTLLMQISSVRLLLAILDVRSATTLRKCCSNKSFVKICFIVEFINKKLCNRSKCNRETTSDTTSDTSAICLAPLSAKHSASPLAKHSATFLKKSSRTSDLLGRFKRPFREGCWPSQGGSSALVSLVILDVARCYLWLFTLYINTKIGKNSC